MTLQPPAKTGLNPVEPPPVRLQQRRHSPVRVEVVWPAGCVATVPSSVGEQLLRSGSFRLVDGPGPVDQPDPDDTAAVEDDQAAVEPPPTLDTVDLTKRTRFELDGLATDAGLDPAEYPTKASLAAAIADVSAFTVDTGD